MFLEDLKVTNYNTWLLLTSSYPDIDKIFDGINFCDVAMTIEGVLTKGV